METIKQAQRTQTATGEQAPSLSLSESDCVQGCASTQPCPITITTEALIEMPRGLGRSTPSGSWPTVQFDGREDTRTTAANAIDCQKPGVV
jgi:hypothetical protein